MIIRLLIPLLIVAGWLPANTDGISLQWRPDRRLVWADFMAEPDAQSTNAALTSSGIEFQYGYADDKLTYRIKCLFERKKSWGKIKTDYILAHEQGHFDISEIHARKLNKALQSFAQIKPFPATAINNTYDQLMKEQTAMQQAYDEGTNHSRNKEQQAIWKEKIKNQLEELKEYAGYNN